jgi:hypothetical protein
MTYHISMAQEKKEKHMQGMHVVSHCRHHALSISLFSLPPSQHTHTHVHAHTRTYALTHIRTHAHTSNLILFYFTILPLYYFTTPDTQGPKEHRHLGNTHLPPASLYQHPPSPPPHDRFLPRIPPPPNARNLPTNHQRPHTSYRHSTQSPQAPPPPPSLRPRAFHQQTEQQQQQCAGGGGQKSL